MTQDVDRNVDRLEPMETTLHDLDVDIHEGATDFPDISAQLPDSSDVQEFGVRFEDAVKHMSVHKYESEASMVREYVANMAATCLEAKETLDEDYSPVIHIAYFPASERLIMEDNGMGMSSEEIETVGIELGVSTNRYTSDRGGKYGIGLLSGLKGVGLDGAFFMHSRSRRTNEYVRGLWSAYGYKTVDALPDKFESEQYGTRFEFPLKDPSVDMRTAIAEAASVSRVPVLYTERTNDGSLIEDDEYGGRSDTPFQDHYSDTAGDVVIDTDAFRAVHSPNAENRTVLLDVPIDRNFEISDLNDGPYSDLRSELPYRKFDVVFKSEDRKIVAGPHKGQTRVSDGEYARMPEDRRDGYIAASDCAPNDIWIPSPAGDRDRFEENPDFWRWLAEQFVDRTDAELERIVSTADETDQILSLPREDIGFVDRWMVEQVLGRDWRAGKLARELDKRDLDDVDDQTVIDFAQISHAVDHCKRGSDPWRSHSRTEMNVYEVLLSTPDDADVWMASHPSEKKANVVWEDHEGHTVVRVGKPSLDQFAEVFGWRRLNYVSEETLDEFDISEETRESFQTDSSYRNPNAGEDAPDRLLTLHEARPSDDNDRGYKDVTEKETARYLRAYFEATAADQRPKRALWNADIEHLVLFPSNSEESMSDYLGVLGYGTIRLATCTVGVWDYLKDLDAVHRIEDYLREARNRAVPTSAGRMAIPAARDAGDSVVLHLLADEILPSMRDTPEMSEAAAWFETERPMDWRADDPEDLGDVVYVPIGDADLNRLLPELRHDDVWLAAHEKGFPIPSKMQITSADNDTKVYAHSKLRNWRDTPEYDLLTSFPRNVTGGVGAVIDGLADLHDAGLPAPSQRNRDDAEPAAAMLEVLAE